jgi:hypothetical protein
MAKQAKRYVITHTRPMSGRSYKSSPLTVKEAVAYYGYSLECGASWQHEKGNKRVNRHPTTIKSLIVNLNNASKNTARNGCGDYYEAVEFVGELEAAST